MLLQVMFLLYPGIEIEVIFLLAVLFSRDFNSQNSIELAWNKESVFPRDHSFRFRRDSTLDCPIRDIVLLSCLDVF